MARTDIDMDEHLVDRVHSAHGLLDTIVKHVAPAIGGAHS